MFFSKKNRIETLTEKNIIITEIYKKGGRTFQLFCDVAKSKGTIGQNQNYCLKLLTAGNGFTILIDNRQMAIPELTMDDGSPEEIVNKINEGFEKLKEFADIL